MNGITSATEAKGGGPLVQSISSAPPQQHMQASEESTVNNGSSVKGGNLTGESSSENLTGSNANQSAPAASAANANGLVYPALHLLPLNNTFVPKQISLSPPGTRVKIGRQTNAKTIPSATNGYFDSKVLSRMHAEVWSEDEKVYIKDVKSSNGTFINGDRLSPESAESDAFELHSDDVVEFGIDIVSDDNKTIVHHKVSTKIHIVTTSDEAVALMKNLPALYRMHDTALHRRPSKSGLTFDHVLNRLSTELHKSRETGGELGGLTNVMAEIHETLGGGVPPPLPQFPQGIRGSHYSHLIAKNGADPHSLALLQAQLTDTQASLAGHAEKVRGLEGLVMDQESIRTQMSHLRDQVETAKQAIDVLRGQEGRGGHLQEGDVEADEAFNDSSSVVSVETLRTPQTSSTPIREQNASLTLRLENLMAELEHSSAQSNSLMLQHESMQQTIVALESRLNQMESQLMEQQESFEQWKDDHRSDWEQDQTRQWAADQRKKRDPLSEDARGAGAEGNVTSDRVHSPVYGGIGNAPLRRRHQDSWLPGEEPESNSRTFADPRPDLPSRRPRGKWTNVASFPLAGTIGLLAMGVAVWLLAQRGD